MQVLRFCLLTVFLSTTLLLLPQVQEAPDRFRGEGPFNQLIIRGITLINGNGAPPRGPIDIVVENNKITNIAVVGYPGVPIDDERRPQLKEGGKELDCAGMYLLPGFVDMHGHIGVDGSWDYHRSRSCLWQWIRLGIKAPKA